MEASPNIGPVSEEEARRALDELVHIRKLANEGIPPRNLDMHRVRDRLETIDLCAEMAIAILKGIA